MGTYCKRATQPCPCGHAGDSSGLCHCTAEQIARYRARISGPLLDRIDLHVEVPRPESFLDESDGTPPEPSAPVRERVAAARALQIERGSTVNARLDLDGLKRHCRLGADSRALLDDADAIRVEHLAEAISYRGNALHSGPRICD